MVVAITGITGNMGKALLKELVKIEEIKTLKLLVRNKKNAESLLKKYKKTNKNFEFIIGNLHDQTSCELLVANSKYVLNLAGVIPPQSDKNPKSAINCNQIGTKVLIDSIEKIKNNQPKLIHISTVAVYGNRNYKHPWVRVGDPLLVNPFDIYSITKMRSEFYILESKIKNWAILRQTAVLHNKMLTANLNDGLMFHTCFNGLLEWVTAKDSAILLAKIITKDSKKNLGNLFWKKCFNIGGGEKNRITGYETLNDGFKIIGKSAKYFFKPNYNVTRNFHGAWFYDGQILNDMFNYQTEDVKAFWKSYLKSHFYFKAGKLVPKILIKKLTVKRLLKDKNSPCFWIKNNDEAKITAYFGNIEMYKKIPKKWKNYNLLAENKEENGNYINYAELKNVKFAKLIDYGFNYKKLDKEITIKDLKNVAKKHGGELLSKSFKTGDIYKKLKWKTNNGIVFTAKPYTILRAGHWFNESYTNNVWNFDNLAKNDKIYSQIWYDSHDKNEDVYYYLDENFEQKIIKRK